MNIYVNVLRCFKYRLTKYKPIGFGVEAGPVHVEVKASTHPDPPQPNLEPGPFQRDGSSCGLRDVQGTCFFWRGCLTQSYHMDVSDNWILYPKISWLIIVLLVSMKTVKLGHARHTQPLVKPKYIQLSSNITLFSSGSGLNHIESQQLVIKS